MSARTCTVPSAFGKFQLTTVIQEAYIQGISTRSVDDLVKALGTDGIAKGPSEPPVRGNR